MSRNSTFSRRKIRSNRSQVIGETAMGDPRHADRQDTSDVDEECWPVTQNWCHGESGGLSASLSTSNVMAKASTPPPSASVLPC